jgi:hypothetical protein
MAIFAASNHDANERTATSAIDEERRADKVAFAAPVTTWVISGWSGDSQRQA